MKPIKNILSFKQHRGFTLIELMVALAVSAIVLLAVGTVYFTSKRSYTVQDEYSRMQQGALYAFQLLTQEVSRSGYAGCNPKIKDQLDTTTATQPLFDYTIGLYGWEYTGGQNPSATGPGQAYSLPAISTAANAANWSDNSSPAVALDANIAQNAIPGSDVLVVKTAQEIFTPKLVAANDINPGDTTIQLTNAQSGITEGAVLLVSDCSGADLFMNSSKDTDSNLGLGTDCGAATPCNSPSARWSHPYILSKDKPRFYSGRVHAYYVGYNKNTNQPALYRYNYSNDSGGTKTEELVDGVENMQILYDVNEDPCSHPNMANHFVTIDQIPIKADCNGNTTNFLRYVYAVRISLLMSTTSELARPLAANTYKLAGVDGATAVSVTPANKDRRIRQVFTTTITLPNMIVTDRE